jgi:cysteine-rich repeat protein
LLAVVTPLANANPVPGDEFVVNSYTTGDQTVAPCGVALDAAGGFVIAWSGPAPSGTTDVGAERFDASGARVGSVLPVNVYTTDVQQVPAVAALGDGFVVAWRSVGEDGDDGGVVARRLDASGAPAGSAFQVSQFTTSNQSVPRVAPLPGAGFVVGWRSYLQDGNGHGVFARRYAAGGAPLGNEFQVNAYTTGNQLSPSLGTDAAGRTIVAWSGPGLDGDLQGIVARRLDANGAPLGPDFVVNTYTTHDQTFPAVAADPAGGFVVAWQGDQAGSADVFARRFDSAGAPLGSEFRVNTYTSAAQGTPTVGVDAGGGFVIAWRSVGQDGQAGGIFGRRFDSGGVPAGTEFRVNAYTTGEQSGQAIAVERDGDFVVTWNSTGPDGSGTGVVARRFADPCGDGIVGPGESCDDGNRLPGDCCSPTCQPVAAGTGCESDGIECTTDACDGAGSCVHAAVPAGTACTSDGAECTVDACDGAGSCAHSAAPAGTACASDGLECTTDGCDGTGACTHTAVHTACPACRRCDAIAGCVARPRTDCRRPARDRQATLQLTSTSPDSKDRMTFAWARGAATTADFGALPSAPDYTLCVFDAAGGAGRLVLDATIPAGGRWKKRGTKGFRYAASGTPDGVTKVDLQSGAGKAKVTVSGKGAALGLPALGLTPPVTAQLQVGGNDGVCFGAEFATPQKNTATTFKAKGR